MPRKEDMKAVKEKFMKWDSDGSGSIGKPEFRKILRECGVPPQNIEMIFTLADVNNDGEISWNEFVNWIFGNNNQASGKDTVNSRARSSIANVATTKVSGVGKQTKTPQQILEARFPDKSSDEVAQALLMAEGHGGKAAAHLAGEITLKPPISTLGHTGYNVRDSGELRDLYGM
mmetsp:Transcript_80066/g.141267  ORF Transcript_80066/g.141267 Transcript_80066/m.141267 type:complete len:174 (-) Transcript_80066:85-606(-)